MDSSGTPVESATVTLYPAKQIAVTSESGYFMIKTTDISSSAYLLINHVAYQPLKLNLDEVKNLTAIEVTLQDLVQSLNEVKVVQDRNFAGLIDKTQPVTIIDKDFIERNNTGTFSGALASLPGVNTMNVGVGIAKPMIRGMSFNRILVNNRGIKQEGQQWGADHGLEIDPFDVENVEVIKGPASLLYGSDGMGGVINIKEHKPLGDNGDRIEYISSYQTNNHAFSNSMEWKGRQNQWYYSARLTHQDFGDYTVPSDEFTYAGFVLPINEKRLKNTAGKELHLSAEVGVIRENIKSSIRFTSFNQTAGIFTGAIGLPRAYNLQHNERFRNIEVPRQENQHIMLISNTTLNLGKHQFDLDLGYQKNTREELSSPGAHGISPELVGSNLALGLYLATYTANLKYRFNLSPQHQLLFGGQMQFMQNDKDGFEYLLPVFNSTQGGVYHYQLFDISKKWILNAGMRYDVGSHKINQHLQPVYDRVTLQPTGELMERTPQFYRNFSNLSGAAGISYIANSNNHLKLNLGTSFRFPTAIELSSNGVHHGNFRHEIGDNDLTPENGYQADLTYLHQSKKLFVEFSTFYAFYNDYIYLAPTGNFSFLASGGTMWQYRQDNSLFNGFELASSYQLNSQLKSELAVDFVQNLNLISGLPLPLTPPPSITKTLEFSNFLSSYSRFQKEYVFLSARYNFEQERVDRNERTTAGSFLLNAGLGFQLHLLSHEIQCRFSVNNLLNEAYFNHISRYRLINLPEQGRNFLVSVKIPINFKNL